MSTQIPKKRAILFILITLNVHEIQTQKFSYRLCLSCLLPWGTYLLPPTFSENSCHCVPGSFPKNLRSKGIPLSPLTKTRLKDFDVSRGERNDTLNKEFCISHPLVHHHPSRLAEAHSGFGKNAFSPNPPFFLRSFYFRRKSAGVFAE